jgi:hypothetical protein
MDHCTTPENPEGDSTTSYRIHADEVPILVAGLVEALTDLGLSAERFGASMVWAVNRAADPPAGSSPHAVRLSPGLRQVVQCRVDDMGNFGWFWVWSSPGALPTYEWFAPAEEIDAAAGKIARVLAVRSVAPPVA